MAWVNRQSPKGPEIFYDHIGYFVHDLNQAGDQLEKLGFQISDTNIQYNEDADGILQRTHTSNKLAKLNLGFIEVLAATGKRESGGIKARQHFCYLINCIRFFI